MTQNHSTEPDYGTGNKNIKLYLTGIVLCVILTLIPFGIVSRQHSVSPTLAIIYLCAILQFLAQVFFFLRLHVKNEKGRMNLMSFVFTILILLVIVLGSLWIMYHLNYNMMH
ncbi:cytochrome o ubiquinol oxidase subunit IV [Candidiatus Paracoxiella cheracis]|uniref:cytochrome o ubiquinol oxidase subunit IV n=1 Tax=Candidiatus Paracoxiella cheracis TaxID=3405120 RepID=UPI003BF4E790